MTELEPTIDLATASLEEVEEFIRPRARAFVAVGLALIAVRERQLFLDAGFDTFAEYTRARWEMDDGHARRICDAARVHELTSNATPAGVGVESEWQARELAPLLDDPDELQATWRDVLAREEPLSASLIRQVRRGRIAPPPAPAAPPAPARRRRTEPAPPEPSTPFPSNAHRIFLLITQAAEEVRALDGVTALREAAGMLDARVLKQWEEDLTAAGELVMQLAAACGGADDSADS